MTHLGGQSNQNDKLFVKQMLVNDAFSIFRRRSFDARRSRLARNVKSAGCLLGGVVRQLLECVYCLWNVSNACLMCGRLL